MHARRLHAAGMLDDAELADAEARLAEIAVGGGIEPEDEDVHSAIERLLGDVGRKIHAGRSRNDQVAAAFRLYVADACAEARAGIAALAPARARPGRGRRRDADAGLHAPPARPARHGRPPPARLGRDARARPRPLRGRRARPPPRARSAPARSPARRSPCRRRERQLRNSLDAVADRDFALDYLYAAAVCFVHLSRIGEELVLWTTAEFGFAVLPEDAATGSSMMPQKLNPDVAELVRGKAGTAIGRLTGLLATVKGLPLAYNRDLQEDKPPVFAARADLRGALGALAVLVARARARPRSGWPRPLPIRSLLATDAAEALVRAGRAVPRRARAGRGVGARRQLRGARRRAAACARARAASARRSRPRARSARLPCDAAASGGVSTA